MVKTKAMMTYRLARRIIITVFGVTVLLIGVALLVLPGPAFIVIPTGLAILSLEFTWAQRWLAKFQEKANGVYHNFKHRRKPSV